MARRKVAGSVGSAGSRHRCSGGQGATVKTQESEEWLLGAAVSSVVCGRPAREGLPPVLVSRCACQGGTGGGGERWQGDLGWEVGGQEGR